MTICDSLPVKLLLQILVDVCLLMLSSQLSHSKPNEKGISDSYPSDRGITLAPDVILFSDFESVEWRDQWSGGKESTLSTVVKSEALNFEPLDNKALCVKIPKGEHYGTSLRYPLKDSAAGEPEEIYFRYYLRFADDWNPAQGGKLPGIGGTYEKGGWGGNPSNGKNGWSARGTFQGQTNGRSPIGFYCYHAEMDDQYGDVWIWGETSDEQLLNNRWYCIEQYAKMNRPAKSDGILRGWLDGRLVFEKTDVRMRDIPDLKIESVWINVYHGGVWSAKSDDHLFIDNVVIAKKYIGHALSKTLIR